MNNGKPKDDKYKWRIVRSCVYDINLHLVFVTKYRRDVFTEEMLSRLKDLFAETCNQMNCTLHEFNGEDDHVHLLVSFPPKLAISNLEGKLKGKSAYFFRKGYWEQLKTSCGVNTSGLPVIAPYPAAERPWM